MDEATVLAALKKQGASVYRFSGEVFLSFSRGTDAKLALVAKLITVRKVTLFDSDVTDKGIAALAKLKSLEELQLYSTKVAGTGFDQLNGFRACAN